MTICLTKRNKFVGFQHENGIEPVHARYRNFMQKAIGRLPTAEASIHKQVDSGAK